MNRAPVSRGAATPERRALPHAEAIDALLARVGADVARGLSASDARARLGRDGPNELPRPRRPNPIAQFFEQFANPIVLILLGAAVVAIVEGAGRRNQPALARFGDATAILLIVLINAVLGFFQERRAQAALQALETMQTPTARVRRDGAIAVVAAPTVVVGDVLELEAGDAVPADARLVRTVNVLVEEASLTGESVPVGKDARSSVAGDAPLGDRSTMLFVGTSVVRGKARAVVVATGPRTELGHLSALIHRPRERKTPLEQKLASFGTRILWACLALSTILFVRGAVHGGRKLHELLLEAVSLAVAAIPEGLPAITTITLALGMQRMARRGAIVRKLAAVETLGSATVICTDKTGTLTANEMTVREAYAGGEHFDVTGTGYDPRGEIRSADGRLVGSPSGPLRGLLASAALCNDAELRLRDRVWRVQGDPTEGALLTFAAKGGVSREAVTSSNRVVKELPFDSDRKRMTVVALDGSGREIVHSKGSADVLIPLCDRLETDRGPERLDDARRRALLDEVDRMSEKALRVLAVARRDLGPPAGPEGALPEGDLEERLTFLGLVGMIDPPREGVREAVALCARAHLRAVMITGDHKLTAVAIAKELGLWDAESVALTGAELDALSDQELDGRVEAARVFARVTAEQKLRIVGALKRRGHVVAMTGDGVNDAPALREAHIGVAMGKDGTDVAREAADMVIADDNFATIVEAVREGRSIWHNIQKFIFFLLSSNAGLLVAVFWVSFFTAYDPLSPLMILWINLVTNGLPALALGVDPPDRTQMNEPPRQRTAGLLGTRDWLGIGFVGAWMGAAAAACYFVPSLASAPESSRHARAAAFSLLALSPLLHALECRSQTESIVALRPVLPMALAAAIVVSAGVHLVAIAVPSLRPVFQTFPMSAAAWGLLLLLAASIVPGMELYKLGCRRFARP